MAGHSQTPTWACVDWRAFAVVALAIVLVASFLVGPVTAQNVRRDSFESGAKTGRELGGDTEYRVLDHQRYQGQAHSGNAFEYWHISASNGSFVHVGYSTPHARIIDELGFSIWVNSDRGGPSLSARVVLPRTIDPRTKAPATVLVRGGAARDPGHWEELRVENIRREVTRAAQRLRTEIDVDVDEREAYVDQLVVNIYAGPGETKVSLDDLEIRGLVERVAANSQPRVDQQQINQPANNQQRSVNVRRSGTQLLVNGSPFFPRAIQFRGEPLDALKRMGFNAIHVDQIPTRELLQEAQATGLWVIAPPPLARSSQGQLEITMSLGPEWDAILAWDLGLELSARDVAWVEQAANQLDRHSDRPVICSAVSGLRELSRSVDILCPARRPLESTLDLADYATWLREHPRLTRPGIPRWTVIQTEPTLTILRQQSGLAGIPLTERTLDFDALRLAVYNAVACGVRGVIFSSRAPLDTDGDLTRRRAMMLELLNLELELIEPWLAGGTVTAWVRGNQADITAAVFRTERARLLLPMWTGPGSQLVPGQSAGHDISITAPGVPETDEVYEIAPGGRFRIGRRRVAGGVLITLKEFDLTTQVLLTQDASIVNAISQRLAQITHRAVTIRRELTAARLRETEIWNRRMAAAGLFHPHALIWINEAKTALARCDESIAAGDDSAAYVSAARAARPLRMLEHEQFEKYAGGNTRALASSPLSASIRTLPEWANFARQVDVNGWNLNRLSGGDCENLDRMVRSGWQHEQQEVLGVHAAADLAFGDAHSGSFSLRLRVAPQDPESMPAVVETAPVWVSTPPVNVAPGEIVRIHGWVKVPAPITGSVDGLAIADSLGGPELMLRIGATDGWQEFVIYRHIDRPEPLVVTAALFGMGEAYLDDVTIETLRRPTPQMGTQPRNGPINPAIGGPPSLPGQR